MNSKTIKLHNIPADSTGQLIDAIAPAIGLIKNCPIFKMVSPKANALLNYVGRTTQANKLLPNVAADPSKKPIKNIDAYGGTMELAKRPKYDKIAKQKQTNQIIQRLPIHVTKNPKDNPPTKEAEDLTIP